MTLNRIWWVGLLMVCCWVVVQGLESHFFSIVGKQTLLVFIFLSDAVAGRCGILVVGAYLGLSTAVFVYAGLAFPDSSLIVTLVLVQ